MELRILKARRSRFGLVGFRALGVLAMGFRALGA